MLLKERSLVCNPLPYIVNFTQGNSMCSIHLRCSVTLSSLVTKLSKVFKKLLL